MIKEIDNSDKCPECGSDLEFDEVDIGVGVLRGNAGCPECHWAPSKIKESQKVDKNRT